MAGYRCYLMSGEHIRAVQTYECADDAAVILKASEFLEAHPEHASVEIWEGKRFVASFTRNPKATPSEVVSIHGAQRRFE